MCDHRFHEIKALMLHFLHIQFKLDRFTLYFRNLRVSLSDRSFIIYYPGTLHKNHDQ